MTQMAMTIPILSGRLRKASFMAGILALKDEVSNGSGTSARTSTCIW